MRILLTALNARFSHSSLALRYLRSYCTAKDGAWEMQLAEYTINDQTDYILGEIYRKNADLVAFSGYIWNIDKVLAVCRKLKKIRPEVIIVLGGPEVSYAVAEFMQLHPYLDYVVFGEGEATFKELLHNLTTQPGTAAVAGPGILGLAYREGNGVKLNPARPVLEDLDQIPFPYPAEAAAELKNRVVYYESSRGCPYSCQYCLSSLDKGVRYFSLERVKQDLLLLMAQGAETIKFVDRTFNCHPARAREIFSFLLEQTPAPNPGARPFRWHFEIGAALLDKATLELLKQAPVGLFEFEIGVQSTHEATLTAVMRKPDWPRLKPVVQQLAKPQNIHLHLDLIAGLPRETYATFRRSFNDVFSLRPHLLQLGFLKLLKGSGLREQAASFGCRYADDPPYEVLATDTLDYGQLLRLHAIEDLVEKYCNSQRFQHSLNLLLYQSRQTPFDLFERMAVYWEAQGLHQRLHNLNALFRILGDFGGKVLSALNLDRGDLLEVLKFDYLLQSAGVQPAAWFPRTFLANQKQRTHDFLGDHNIVALLPHFQGYSAREINKHVHIEIFQLDVIALAEWLKDRLQFLAAAPAEGAAVDLDRNRTLPAAFFKPTPVLFDNSVGIGLLRQPAFYRVDL